MTTPLRELLASFVVEVDKAGELAKGNLAIDALKARLGDLQAAFDQVKAPAARAGKAIQEALSGFGATPGLAAALQQHTQNQAASLFGNFGAGSGLDRADGTPDGPVLGPTRDTLNAARAATAQADAAAAKYATTLRGRLAGAVKAVRDGFSRGGGGGGEGPGLIERLKDFRTQVQLLAGSAVVVGVKRLVDSIGDIGEEAQRLGVTTDQFQRLRVLAEQNGTSVQSLGTAFRTLANSAVQPTKESTAAFEKLSVSTKDANGQFKSTNDLFFEVAEALSKVGNETQRSALAQDLLGRSAQELKPIFAGGAAAIEAQRKALGEMNVISPETIAQADELSDSWKALGPSLLASAEPLLKILIPALTQLTQLVFKGIEAFGKWLKQTDLTSVAITALGAAVALKLLPGLELMVGLGGGATKVLLGMAGAGAKALWSFLRLALPLLAIEDFITFLRGGDSETGRLLDAVFGKGTAEGTLQTLKDLADAFKDLWKWMTGDGQGEKVKKLFQDIDDGIVLIANDLLAKLGIGKGGLNGAIPVGQQGGDFFGDLGTKLFKDIPGSVAYNETHGKTMPAPALPPTGFYGPPNAAGSVQGNATTFGDTNVTVTMGPSASAGDVGNSVVSAVTEERNRIVGAYGGF